MSEVRPDPHAAILTWLDENDGHDAVSGKLAAAVRTFVEPHRMARVDPADGAAGWVTLVTFCASCTQPWPCDTIRTAADALGVAK